MCNEPGREEGPMVNINLFIELIRAARAPDVADRIKGV
jgi:hypothetical protein